MRNCFAIYRRDLSAISKNYAALVVVIALCILPSFYAWFNIKAAWDPYAMAATSGVKIGVVNEDKGVMLEENVINLGERVVEELKKNTQLGWQFVDADTAHEALVMGEYYATITIPENFSQDVTSILSTNIQKGKIIYTVNEKLNAIAPKLTDKGVASLQTTISKQVVETVSAAIFELGNEIGVNLETQIPTITAIYNYLTTLQGQFNEINKTVDLTEEGVIKLQALIGELEVALPQMNTTIENAKGFTKSIQDFMTTSKESINQTGPMIKQDIQIISHTAQEISEGVQALKEAIASQSEQVPELIVALKGKVNSLQTLIESLNKVFTALNNIKSHEQITDIIAQLNDASNQLEEVMSALNQIEGNLEGAPDQINPIFNQIITIGNNLNEHMTVIYEGFDDKLMTPINQILDKAYEVAGNADEVLVHAQESLPEVEDFLTTISVVAQKGSTGIDYIKEILPRVETILNKLLAKLSQIESEAELEKVVNLLKADVTARSNFLANPVEITNEVIYPMHNYGTSMTPFYTVLCLWVGGLLLASILTVEAEGEYKPYEVYFGKLLLFMSIGIVQALIVALGDLYLLKIYCMNPVLFILSNCFVGIVFSIVVYSLVSVLGNVGKVVAIILLILQVAGSGGTFPVQMTPTFFQVLNPFLPFTYGISLNREAIGGVVGAIYCKGLIFLLIYMVVAIVFAVLLKKPINKLLEKSAEKFKESGIGE